MSLAHHFLRAGESPLRYAHTPDSLAALQNYLRFASRLMSVPQLHEQAWSYGSPMRSHYDAMPQMPQAMNSFLQTGHPADLMAYMDMLHQDRGVPQPQGSMSLFSTSGMQSDPMERLIHSLHNLHQSDARAQENPFHVGRFMGPQLLTHPQLIDDVQRQHGRQMNSYLHSLGDGGRGLGWLPELHDMGHVGHDPLYNILDLATANARRARQASGVNPTLPQHQPEYVRPGSRPTLLGSLR